MRTGTIILACILLVAFGCRKETSYVVEGSGSSIPPGPFIVVVSNITDIEAHVEWTKASYQGSDSLSYEVALDDSVIAYGLRTNTGGYNLNKLLPDHKYTVSVIAVNKTRDQNKVNQNFNTAKAFLDSAFFITLEYDEYSFLCGIKTPDGGYLISGFGNKIFKKSSTVYFLLRLNPDLSKAWKKEYSFAYHALCLCNDQSFLAISDNVISRINPSGNLLWNYTFPDVDKVYLEGAGEDAGGNAFALGHSSRNPGGSAVMDQYFVAKLSSSGSLDWKQFGGNTVYNYPRSLIALPNGNLLLFGRAETTGAAPGSPDDWRDADWLLTLDPDGNFLGQNFYSNGLPQNSDMPLTFISMPDGGFMLFGTATGIINGYGDSSPRFLRLNPDMSVHWDKMYYLCSTGIFPGISDYETLGNGTFLILCSDDEGLNISTLGASGELINQVGMSGFPVGLFIKKGLGQKVTVTAKTGDIFLINLDGYVGSSLKTRLEHLKDKRVRHAN